MDYQAKLSAPFGMVGIRCDDAALLGIDFLPAGELPISATGRLAGRVCAQLLDYFADPDAPLCIPYRLNGTAHQQRVWHALLRIPRGQTRSYGELATELHSSAQAVGQACGANPLPLVIPCHRVVGKAGAGGFMRCAGGEPLEIKRWLLVHEQR